MLKSTVKRARKSTTALLVAVVPIRIANRIMGAKIYQLAKVDVMCPKTKYIQNANSAPIEIVENLLIQTTF